MSRLTADDLRARMAGVRSDDSPIVAVPQAPRDLVSATMERYRSAPAPRPGFRRGAAAAEAATSVPKEVKNRRANSYGDTCVTCDTWVAAGEGYLTKNAEDKWAAEHQAGECGTADTSPEAQAVAAVEATQTGVTTIRAVTGQTYTGILPGIYTLDKGGDHRTFRVRVQSTEDDFHPGSTILEHLTGPDNSPSSKDWTSFAFLRGSRMNIWVKHKSNEALLADAREFLADPEAALKSRTCIRCDAELTVPESVRVGMGPVCRSRGW